MSMYRQMTTLGFILLAAATSAGCSFHLGSANSAPQPAYYSYQNGYAKAPREAQAQPARASRTPASKPPRGDAPRPAATTPSRANPEVSKPKRA
ncbi:MAG: hypothetical protein ACRBN8_21245, partial [Nannocystales bacterium]